LSLDRTNWKFGACEINLLVLGIVYQGVAYPIVWFALEKAGNASTEERIAILEIFLEFFGKERIGNLVADREAALSHLLSEKSFHVFWQSVVRHI
jgi:hypothetical protein